MGEVELTRRKTLVLSDIEIINAEIASLKVCLHGKYTFLCVMQYKKIVNLSKACLNWPAFFFFFFFLR